MAYTMDTTISDLVADPRVKPAIDQYFPGLSNSPMLGMVSGLTLRMAVNNPLAPQLGITQSQVDAFLVEVNKRAA